MGTPKRKSSSCPGRPPGMEPGYFSSTPGSSTNPAQAIFLQDLSSSICKMGGCRQMDSWWATVARSGGKTEKQVNRWWPHSPGGQVSVYRLSSRRKHPLQMGQESDCIILTVCLAEGPSPPGLPAMPSPAPLWTFVPFLPRGLGDQQQLSSFLPSGPHLHHL